MSTLAALPTSSTQGPGYSAQAWQYHASRLASCVSTPPPPTVRASLGDDLSPSSPDYFPDFSSFRPHLLPILVTPTWALPSPSTHASTRSRSSALAAEPRTPPARSPQHTPSFFPSFGCTSPFSPAQSSPLRRRLPTPSSSHPSPRVTVPPLGFTSTSPLTLDDLDALDPYADPAIFAALMASVRRPDEFDGDMEEWKGGGREEEGEKDGMEWEMDA